MKKRTCQLILAIIIMAGFSLFNCSCEKDAAFNISTLVIVPDNVESGTSVEISATITNSGGTVGNYTATLTIAGLAVESKTIEMAAGTSGTVAFEYTPTSEGTFTVNVNSLNGSLTVSPGESYYTVHYKAVEGSYIVMNYSPAQVTPIYKKIYFDESSGIGFTMLVNKSVVNGARDIIVPAVDWVFPSFEVENLITGIDLYLAMPIVEDGTGILYVEDDIGDIDMSSESVTGRSPIQVDTQGDGIPDPAGSMLLPLQIIGTFETTVGQSDELPFDIIFTTGHTDNIIHTTLNKKMDGAHIESEGVPFAKDGGKADYVGTAGTITTTGSGDCLGIRLVGVRIDMHTEIKLVLEPGD